MEIAHTKQDGIVYVEVKEEIDLFHSAKFKDYFEQLLADLETRFILDFQDVTYIDSSGIGVLLSIFKAIKQRGAKIKFVNVQGSVKKVIELTQLYDYFPICQTIEEANEQLKFG